MKFEGFTFQRNYEGREVNALINYCFNKKLKWNKSDAFLKDGYIPVGSVDFIEHFIGVQKPDYYPDFLKDHLHRKVWESDSIKQGTFVKPSDRYKRFTGFIVDESSTTNILPPFICSEVVEFENEWRYYIANGEILCGWWYSGDSSKEDDPAPSLNVKFPKTYCGAVDFGELLSGELALVEAQHPYSIGWYGESESNYAKFIINGWNFICKDLGLMQLAFDELY